MSRVSGKPYFVYVLWSASARRFYIGISDDPSTRLQQHNDGSHRGWTNRYRPWLLIHQEAYPTYALARKREIELKAQKGGVGFYEKTEIDPNQYSK